MRKTILAVITILFVLTQTRIITYAWDNIGQDALNITTGESIVVEPEEPEEPEEPKPDNPTPDNPTPDNPTPPKQETTEKEPSKDTDTETKPPMSDTAQSGKGDTKTGDTAEYLKYLTIMLASFAVMIGTGAVLTPLTIHAVQTRKRR